MITQGWWAAARQRLAHGGDETFEYPWDDLLAEPAREVGARPADCCVAHAVFRAVLPSGRGRPDRSELYLCAHHLHDSMAGLARSRAMIFDLRGRLVAY